MTQQRPDDPHLGAFNGLACGDALGAPVEFLSQAKVEARYGRLTEMVGGGGHGWAPGEWTDDTGMALAVAEGILAEPDDPVQAVGERFLEWQTTAKDVGNTIAAALGRARSIRQGTPDGGSSIDWAAAGRTTPQAEKGKAAGNGSLMRTLPVALAYPAVGQMLDTSARVSAMTHWDPQAEVCCAVYCLWIREILHGADLGTGWQVALQRGREVAAKGKRSEDTPGPTPLPEIFWPRLEAAPTLNLEDLQPSGYAGYVVDCLEAAVWAAIHADSLEEALVALVNLGGETDTMAAVAGGAVGVHFGLGSVPARWLDALYQRDCIENAARGLFELRHLLTYAKPTLPRFSYRELEPGVLYGRNPLSAQDVETIIEAGVSRVLDLREEYEWSREGRFGRDAVRALERSGFERLHVPIVDTEPPSPEILDRTWKVLCDAPATGAVYVHCRAGVERTGTVLAAYLARRDGRTAEETLRRLGESGSGLRPLPHQIKAVRLWLGDL